MERVSTTISNHRATIITVSTIATICGIVVLARHRGRAPSTLRRRNALRRTARDHFTVVIQNSEHDYNTSTMEIYLSGAFIFSIVLGRAVLPDPQELAVTLDISDESASRLYAQMIDAAIRNSVRRMSAIHYNQPGYAEPTTDVLTRLVTSQGTLQFIDSADEFPLAQLLGVADVDSVQERLNSYLYQLKTDVIQDTEHDLEPADPAVNEVKALLYHIAEDSARRKAFLHRGIRCEECGETPIRSIRWHCLNCADFDLCSSCKAMSSHQKNHVFAEIQVPIPVLAQPVEILPVWYSGRPSLVRSTLSAHQRRRLAQRYAFEDEEIDALAVQFSCLVDMAIEDDPSGLHAGIGYQSFVRSLSSASWRPRLRPNLLFERIFSFYDANKNGFIGFDAFVSGIAYLCGDKRFQTLDRAIRGFDVDDDGLISRADILRVLQAKFEVQCHIIHEMVQGEQSEQNPVPRSMIPSSQPLSSAFRGDFQNGNIRHPDDKSIDRHGDSVANHTLASIESDEKRTSGSKDQADMHDATDSTSFKDFGISVTNLSWEEKILLGVQARDTKVSPPLDHSIVLEQTILNALNELLDMIFNQLEEDHRTVVQSAVERKKRQAEIQAYRVRQQELQRQMRITAQVDPLMAMAVQSMNKQDRRETSTEHVHEAIVQNIVPTDSASLEELESEVKAKSLEQLLDSSGYGVRDEIHGQALCSKHDNQISPAEHGAGVQEEEGDGDEDEDHGLQDAASREHGDMDNISDKHLETLVRLEDTAQRLLIRAGQPCLRIEDVTRLVEQDESGELAGLMRSWLEWASF